MERGSPPQRKRWRVFRFHLHVNPPSHPLPSAANSGMLGANHTSYGALAATVRNLLELSQSYLTEAVAATIEAELQNGRRKVRARGGGAGGGGGPGKVARVKRGSSRCRSRLLSPPSSAGASSLCRRPSDSRITKRGCTVGAVAPKTTTPCHAHAFTPLP